MQANRNYYLLLAGQFLGAFGDNFLLAAILGPLTYLRTAGHITEQQVNGQNALYSAVFFVPFILLAPLAGFLSDRMPKTSWLFGGNAIKMLGALVGLLGVWLFAAQVQASWHWQVLSYAIVGIGACVYSPAKYGILPEIQPADRLVKANGTVEMLTMVAILTGLWGGATLYDQVRSLPCCYGASLALYGAALILNALMARTPCNASVTLRNSVGEFGLTLRQLIGNPRLGRMLLGCGVFWFAGAAIRGNLQGWGLQVFAEAGVHDVSNQKLAWLKVGLILGIVVGSVLAGQLHRVGDLGWARRYAMFMALSILLLGLLGGALGVPAIVAVLTSAGVFAGLLIVPLNAALQNECDHTRLGKTVAIQNFIDYVSMLVGVGFLAVLTKWDLSSTQVFLALPIALLPLAFVLRIPAATPSVASAK